MAKVSSRASLDFPAEVVLRWAMKAFLVGLFLGVAAGISALIE